MMFLIYSFLGVERIPVGVKKKLAEKREIATRQSTRSFRASTFIVHHFLTTKTSIPSHNISRQFV
jgi:hypothetical protein